MIERTNKKLAPSTQLQNRLFHVFDGTRTAIKCTKMKIARAKRAKLLFFSQLIMQIIAFRCACVGSLMTHAPNSGLERKGGKESQLTEKHDVKALSNKDPVHYEIQLLRR